MTMIKEEIAGAEGFVKIIDAETGEILLEGHNEIHKENFSEALALSFAKYDKGVIEEMVFGNGGTIIEFTGELDYNTPNVTGINADLYNPTYSKVVNDRSPYFTSNPLTTNIKVEHITGTFYSDIVVTCYLGKNEPSDAAPYDDLTVVDGHNSTNPYARYVFDEIGLKTVDYNTNVKRLLTHFIFHPFQKSQNRAIEIIYTIRINLL